MSTFKSTKQAKKKNAPGNRSDIAWQHGLDIDKNGKRVQYNYCKKCFSGVYRFKHHLVGTKEDAEACISVPENIRDDMLKIVAEINDVASRKKRRNYFDDGDGDKEETLIVMDNQGKVKDTITQFFAPSKHVGGNKAQTTINQAYKKEFREEVCSQVARFFYTSALSLNVVKNPEFEKKCDMIGRFGVRFKPPFYHEIREKYLK